MSIDGHILCRNMHCHRVLLVGKYKDGRFWHIGLTAAQIEMGVGKFVAEHFAHGELSVLGDDRFEAYLDACPQRDWPTNVFIEVAESGEIRLVDQPRQEMI